MNTIYFDNNATTPVALEVLDEMLPHLKKLYGNPSSMHTFGGQLHKKVEEARGKVAQLIGAEPEEIIFTSCGTESDNTAIMSAVESLPNKKHIITTRVEHPAVLNFCKHLTRKGFRVTFLPVNNLGQLNIDELLKVIDKDIALVSIMYSNNETGVIFPIADIAEILKERRILFHTDAVQAVGKIPIDTKELPVDMLSLSGHKLHAPKGVGALYVRKGTRFYPFIIGGHQERGRRAGTENVASIIGLGKACELAGKNLTEEITYLKGLRDKLETALLKSCPDVRVNGDINNRLPNTTNLSFEYVEGEAVLLRINEYGICASSGSACTSGSLEPSHVLRAMGVPFTAIHGSIRFSLSRYNTEAEIDRVIEIMPEIIKELRMLSPFGRDRLDQSIKCPYRLDLP
ncbi:MAG: cysteine desulfurase NifS [Nitrospirae bacterium CG_4_10_14_0_8_um_filter_41_23]|nr:cysteine desulfurase NifS [Nitrospirota bacterium]OIP59646.1 MAG: cysteine desulfurase NifS [Nitrospirae bacterium CG2_30_41_42]PIQ93950.1 MAG: cysteine desulfurase NifS [Nitrospirae bacterium CG11_big_fil_rev_8_21_14_0_20_41_14]PIV44234.1 MAG: cysteine desulfurase NifS [Nitrospirae bacterium CG02_land_8_20_14_3_00_41_53]PIW86888.1 MAG: cysteine desulfurase NifS [Nitrospirae bacterium CG_4_8_14_3_um_filter_41_47]PIY87420.1 MAG: cysteine desulfurase NifS [Nitrospirae bacterium CG_4_10_14_0_8